MDSEDDGDLSSVGGEGGGLGSEGNMLYDILVYREWPKNQAGTTNEEPASVSGSTRIMQKL